MPFLRRNSPLTVPTVIIGGPDRAGAIFTSTIITNSGVMRLGDVVEVMAQASGNGGVVRRYNAAGNKILGICVGFGRANGAAVAFDSGTNDTVTVAADNETVAQIFARVDVTPHAVWSAPLSAAIHTTAIARAGAFADPDTGANAGRVLESGLTVTQSTERGLAILGPDPEGAQTGASARVLCMIVEGLYRGANAAS